MASLDNISSSLGKSIQSAAQVARHLEGEHRSVNNANVGSSVDQVVVVDNTTELLGHHSGSRDVVVVGTVDRLQPVTPDGVGSVGRDGVEARKGLGGKNVAQRSGSGDLSGSSGGGNLLLDVIVEQEVVGVDGGRSRGVGRLDVNVSTRERHQTPVLDQASAG